MSFLKSPRISTGQTSIIQAFSRECPRTWVQNSSPRVHWLKTKRIQRPAASAASNLWASFWDPKPWPTMVCGLDRRCVLSDGSLWCPTHQPLHFSFWICAAAHSPEFSALALHLVPRVCFRDCFDDLENNHPPLSFLYLTQGGQEVRARHLPVVINNSITKNHSTREPRDR